MDCPECVDGKGWYYVRDCVGEPTPQQCRTCYERNLAAEARRIQESDAICEKLARQIIRRSW